MKRTAKRTLSVSLGALVVAATLTSVGASAMATSDGQGRLPSSGRFDQPQPGFAPPSTTLRTGSPADAGLDPGRIAAAERYIAGGVDDVDPATGHPAFPGAVGLYAHDGVIVDEYAVGDAVRYADAGGTELPPDQRVPMRPDTIFDLASVTKLFTAIETMQLVEEGKVDVDAPVARYLPEFATNGKSAVTVKELLTHTSGFDADPSPSLWQGYPDIPSRKKAVLDSPLKNPPGSTYLYSDLNMLTLGILVEQLRGEPLDRVVHEYVTGPLGMADTGYDPPASKLDRIAATEYETMPPRGMVRGSVHDENAWALGGVAGHAGIFSTVGDMAVLCQAILNGGTYGGHRILKPETTKTLITNYNQAFPTDQHGMGFELDQPWYMGGLSSAVTAGHTGYTGTTLVVDPESRSIALLFTNRVHPSRTWTPSINVFRQVWATGLALAMAVKPAAGPDMWFSEIGNAGTATLATPPLSADDGTLDVSFDAFVDTEGPSDPVVLESSTDGVTWQPVAMTAAGPGAPAGSGPTLYGHGHRAWWNVHATVQAGGPVTLRWRYTTDAKYTGRGVSVDGVLITSGGRTVFDGERENDSFTAVNWAVRAR